MVSFQGKVALVTGANGGLGAALCERLLAEGANVVAFDRDKEALDALGELIGKPANLMPLVGDITDGEAIDATASVIEETLGRLDYLIHNAGVTHFSRFTDSGGAVTRRVMEINFMGAVMLTEAVLPLLLRSKGSIAAMSSVAGFAPLFARTAYSASKHALHGFFESLRSELVDDGVHVMMVCPSFIATQAPTSDGSSSAGQGLSRPGSATETAGKALEPGEVADLIIAGLKQRKRQLIIGKLARLSWVISRLFPGFYEKKMLESMRGEVS